MRKFVSKALASSFLLMGAAQAETVSIPERLMVDLQADLHLSTVQAAAITGNLAHETRNFQIMQEMNPLVRGSRGGFGYAQWTGPRRRAFEKFGEGQDLSRYEVNYAFLIEELTTSYAQVLDRLKNMTDLKRATRYVMTHFLGPDPAHANLSRRVAYAHDFLKENFYGAGCESQHVTTMEGRHEKILDCNSAAEFAQEGSDPQDQGMILTDASQQITPRQEDLGSDPFALSGRSTRISEMPVFRKTTPDLVQLADSKGTYEENTPDRDKKEWESMVPPLSFSF